jgi:peptidoglycan L-alanyl-D-glutamate endopeptidase CwlK
VSDRVDDLEPITQAKCKRFMAMCAQRSILLRVTHTLRTLGEQLHLYQQGRVQQEDGSWIIVDPSHVVTKAMPGESPHNYGMAFDVCFLGGEPYPQSNLRWQEIGEIGEGLGLSWGGPLGVADKFTWDRPHFERRDWKAAVKAKEVA